LLILQTDGMNVNVKSMENGFQHIHYQKTYKTDKK
jgi:hypothetical protein